MSQKVFRDPLYNYVGIDTGQDRWLLDVIDSREFQRLRRIHQLGVSSFTYAGADHSRLCHSLGVLHLMQMAYDHLSKSHSEAPFKRSREVLLAAALVHDVGHGPFSHLFEPCLGIDHDHEDWSQKIILDPDCEIHQKLKDCDPDLPQKVADLINPENQDSPPWQKYLISSQLDMDRLDYLRRDSLFTGAGYGHFDWHRLITTMEFQGDPGKPNEWEIVWNAKAKLAIEEYIFSRYYMYQNVYLHKTTRGFEQMLLAMWKRARELRDSGNDVQLVPAIEAFWKTRAPSTREYLAIEEFTVLSQIQIWRDHSDSGLKDLAARFLDRRPFFMLEAPETQPTLDEEHNDWDVALQEMIESHQEYRPAEMYCLIDAVKSKYHQPYIPEKESEEQSVKTAIRVVTDSGEAVEISKLLPRLRPLTEPVSTRRYYIPHELKQEALKLRKDFCSQADS